MPSLSVRDVKADVLKELKRRAKEHHRSLQGEVATILEEVVHQSKKLTAWEAYLATKASGLRTPSESVRMIRQDRDAR